MATSIIFGAINLEFILRGSQLPKVAESIVATERLMRPGGSGTNQAIAATMCGATCQLVGAVGEDPDGTSMLKSLQDRGVDVAKVSVVPEVPTGLTTIHVDEHGRTMTALLPGANLELLPTLDEAHALLNGAAVVTASFEIPAGTVDRVAAACVAQRVPFILNISPFHPVAEATLHNISVVVANGAEAGAMTRKTVQSPDDAIAAAIAICDRGPKAVVITLAGRGAVVVDADGSTLIPAPATDVVDAAGAGDAFLGAFTAYFAEGQPVVEAARNAVKVASLSVKHPGAQLPADIRL